MPDQHRIHSIAVFRKSHILQQAEYTHSYFRTDERMMHTAPPSLMLDTSTQSVTMAHIHKIHNAHNLSLSLSLRKSKVIDTSWNIANT